MNSAKEYKIWDICLICTGMGQAFKRIYVEKADQNARSLASVCAMCYLKMVEIVPVYSNKYIKEFKKDLKVDMD